MIKPLLILFLLFISLHLPAQQFVPDPDWRFENFSSQNHFISREVPDITMDKQGYIWTCGGGLQRFDGYKTIEYNSFDQRKDNIKSNYTDIIADSRQRIWVNSAGLCYYDNANDKFIYVQPDKKHLITYVNALFAQGNYLWFICDYGLAKLNITTLQLSLTSLKSVINPLGIYLINDSTLLISSRERVYTYNIEKDTYQSNSLVYNHVLLKIYATTKNYNDIYLGTNHGLFLFKSLHDVSLLSKQTKDIVIADLLFMPQDKRKQYLFIATSGKGVIVYNTVTKKIALTYQHNEDNPFSLPNNVVSKLYTDRAGRLWMATGLGMCMLDINNQKWKTRFLNRSGADDLNITKIERDKYDSTKVWMACFNKGLVCVNWQTKEIEKIYNTDPEMQKLNGFVQLSANKWLLSTSKKIMEWDPNAGIRSKKSLPLPDSINLVCSIRSLVPVGANTCFITTTAGLFKYDMVTHKISAASLPGSKNKTDVLKYDLLNGFYDNGLLWVASRSGLFNYNIANHITTVYRGAGQSSDYYFFDISRADDNLIVCAAGDGINLFNKQTKSFKVINTIANLYKPDCVSVMGLNNMVWINSEAGILNYNLVTHASERAEHENPQLQIFPGSPFTVIGNNIVIGFSNGYAYFTPDQQNNLMPSAPVIESVYVNNRQVLQQCPTQNGTNKLVLSHADNSINITFTAFLYNDPDHIKFRYRLSGANNDWQYARNQRSANYAQLPPGSYTFYVQGGNGNWNKQMASFGFIIKPAYWATWWFRALVILAIGFILYRLYRYKINHMLAIEKIRERIASDFHDDIGSALSSISIFSEVADNQLKQQLPAEKTREVVSHISFHSRAMLDAMDDIVWAVNPQNDHFNDLAVRMREFAIPLLEARNIQFDIDIQENILNTRIKMEARKNIFMVFKECINNIIKHSDCTAIKVTAGRANNRLELIISDNGKGFDLNAPSTRNGLKNMKKRAAEINGTLQVTSQPGNGTTTRLLVNII